MFDLASKFLYLTSDMTQAVQSLNKSWQFHALIILTKLNSSRCHKIPKKNKASSL